MFRPVHVAVHGLSFVMLLTFWGVPSLAITVAELKEMVAAGQSLVIIDIRHPARYEQAHIPNAISIPAASLERKKLPPFGVVVAYGDGIDETQIRNAAKALNQNPGIEVHILDGGFPAWEAEARVTTRGAGLFDEAFEHLSFEELVAVSASNKDVVLIDLRPPESPGPGGSGASQTSLAKRFRKNKTLKPTRSRWQKFQGGSVGAGELLHLRRMSRDKLYVLIDQGDNSIAEAVARSLRSRGIRRVAILAGGDKAMRPEGQPATETRTFPEE